MKGNLIKLLFLFVILMAVTFAASAQVYVKIRPVVPTISIRPPQPHPTDIWIGEEWEPRGSAYSYSGGHWETPPHPGYSRRPGYWKHHHKYGEHWIQGSWKRD
jgi:hypothetical protein